MMISGVDYSQRWWSDVHKGGALPHVVDPISFRRVIMNPGATWDYFPGHHDPEYARAQGQPTIYVNTMHFLGFIDRMATDWGGPRTFIVSRRVTLRRSIYAGDSMVGDGHVVRKFVDEQAGLHRHLVELAINVSNQRGDLCVPSTVIVELPLESGEAAVRQIDHSSADDA